MTEKNLFIGIGGVGKTQISKLMFDVDKTVPDNPKFLIIDSSEEDENTKSETVEIKTEEKPMNNEENKMIEKLEAKFNELFSDLDEDLPDPDDEINTIILNDENGEETEFEFMDLIEYEGEKYVVLLPVEDTEEAGKVVILKLEGSDKDDEESYVSVDDDEVLQTVFDIFKEKFKDEFNFID